MLLRDATTTGIPTRVNSLRMVVSLTLKRAATFFSDSPVAYR